MRVQNPFGIRQDCFGIRYREDSRHDLHDIVRSLSIGQQQPAELIYLNLSFAEGLLQVDEKARSAFDMRGIGGGGGEASYEISRSETPVSRALCSAGSSLHLFTACLDKIKWQSLVDFLFQRSAQLISFSSKVKSEPESERPALETTGLLLDSFEHGFDEYQLKAG